MQKYQFRDGPVIIKAAKSADAQVIGNELMRIREKTGSIEPENIVKMAESKRSPIHKHFEWDNEKAGHEYRKAQARNLVRLVRIDNGPANDLPERAFHSIRDESGRSYRPVEEVRSSLDLQLALMKQAEKDLDSWLIRYRSLSGICELVEAAKAELVERKKRFETRAVA